MELALDHPRFHTVDAAIFTRRMAPDCMTHRCTVVQDEHGTALAHPIVRNDVCCQYGCDVDLAERDAILARAGDIGALLRPEAAAKPWFDDELFHDADYPSGAVVRSAVHEGACIFIAHDQRGCAIHRAALESGWDMRGVKPAICRLYPVSYDEAAIILAPEYPEYSCAHTEGPTLYRLTRDLLAELFGEALVVALDAAEARALAAAPEAGAAAVPPPLPSPAAKRLPVV